MKTVMTKKEALKILIKNAARLAAGSGTGIRENLTEKTIDEVREAIKTLYKDAYGQEFYENVLFNRGL